MTKAVFTKRGGVFIPADEEARAVMDSVADGRDVMLDVRASRRPKQHRTFFAMLNLLVENSGAFDNIEQALTALKIAIGEADPIIDAGTGKTFWTLRSIAFESCDQARFNRIFERALYVITTRWLIGTSCDELREQVFAIVEDKAAASLGKRVTNQLEHEDAR